MSIITCVGTLCEVAAAVDACAFDGGNSNLKFTAEDEHICVHALCRWQLHSANVPLTVATAI